jgi:hypothetical protein
MSLPGLTPPSDRSDALLRHETRAPAYRAHLTRSRSRTSWDVAWTGRASQTRSPCVCSQCDCAIVMAIVPVLYLCVPKAASTEPVWVAIATTYATKTLAKAFDARLQPSIVQVKDLKPLVCASSSTWLVPASQDLHRL